MLLLNKSVQYMQSLRNNEQRPELMRFFMTGSGDYAESDEFLGLKVSQTCELEETIFVSNAGNCLEYLENNCISASPYSSSMESRNQSGR